MRKTAFATLAAAAVSAVLAAVASATAPVTHTFGDAAWVPAAGETGFGLVTTSNSSGTYGGATMKNFPSDPNNVTDLSFDFSANQTGASGGSPRLVVAFSDGGNAVLRPLDFTANTWTTVDGMSGNTDWDNDRGGCGFRYAVTWQSIVACHPGSTITGMWVVNDSGWLYPDGLTVTLDNITVNNLTSAGPGNAR